MHIITNIRSTLTVTQLHIFTTSHSLNLAIYSTEHLFNFTQSHIHSTWHLLDLPSSQPHIHYTSNLLNLTFTRNDTISHPPKLDEALRSFGRWLLCATLVPKRPYRGALVYKAGGPRSTAPYCMPNLGEEFRNPQWWCHKNSHTRFRVAAGPPVQGQRPKIDKLYK